MEAGLSESDGPSEEVEGGVLELTSESDGSIASDEALEEVEEVEEMASMLTPETAPFTDSDAPSGEMDEVALLVRSVTRTHCAPGPPKEVVPWGQGKHPLPP